MLSLLALAVSLVLLGSVYRLGKSGRVQTIQFGAMVSMMLFIGMPLAWFAIFGALPLATDFLYTSLSDVTRDDGDFILYLCAVTLVSIAALALLPRRKKMRVLPATRVGVGREKVALMLAASIYIVGTAAVYLYSVGSEEAHWYRSREEFVANTGLVGVVISYMITGARLVVIASIAKLVGKVGFTRWTSAVCLVFSLYDVLVTGNRVGLLLLLFCLFSMTLLRREYRVIALSIVAAPLLAYVLSLYAYVRPYLRSDAGLASIMEASSENIAESSRGVGSAFLGAVESVNISVLKALYGGIDADSPRFGSTYARPALIFIPRSVWPDKPDSPTVQAGEAYAHGRTSLVVMYIGEGVMNFGRLGFVIGLGLIVLAISMFGRAFGTWGANDLMQAMLAFLAIRMAFSDVVLWALGAYVIWVASGYVSRLRFAPRGSAHV